LSQWNPVQIKPFAFRGPTASWGPYLCHYSGYCNTGFAAFKHTDPKCVLVEVPVVTQPVCKTVPCSHHSTTIQIYWSML